MRWPALVLLAACGGQAATVRSPEPQPAAAAPGFAATRWVPEHPTYLLASRSLSDLLAAWATVRPELAAALRRQAVAAGLDLDGGAAVFSEDVDPTAVVHLRDPAKARDLLGRFARGPCADGVCGLDLGATTRVSWAIDGDWIWLHVGPAGAAPATWLAHSRHHGPAAWLADWSFARRLGARLHAGAGQVLGFIDPRALFERVSHRAAAALACARVVRPIERVGFAAGADLSHADVRVAFDVGASAADVQRAVLPPPPGWDAVFGAAPLEIQLNLDLDAFADWLQPCADLAGIDLRSAHAEGLRAFRLGVASVDSDASWGTGAVAIDQRDPARAQELLDQIPLRSHLEHDRDFGSHHGHRLAIPFKGTIDYVLEDHLAMLALGDDVLARLVTGVPAGPPPAIAIDVRPAALPEATWQALLDRLDIHAGAVLDLLASWRDLHLGLEVDHEDVVLELSGNRK